MKILKRLFIALFILITLLIAAAVAVPVIYKKDIVALIKSDVNSSIDAQVDFDEDIGIKILPSFPNLTVEIENIIVVGKSTFNSDTLAQCSKVVATIGLKQLYKNQQINLIYLELNQPNLNLISTGQVNNWDILVSEHPSNNDIELSADFNKIIVQDGIIGYTDTSSLTQVSLEGISGSFSGNYANDTFDLVSLFDCADALISYDNIPYVYHLPIKAEAITSINLLTSAYQFKENQFWTGGIEIAAEGGLTYTGDSLDIDIAYASNNATFQDLLTLVPAYYKEDLSAMNATGAANVSGTVKGTLSDSQFPGYSFQMNLINGTLAHQELPEDVQNVTLDLFVNNDDGNDESLTIHLKQFGFNFEGNPFVGELFTSDLYGDPLINGMVKGELVLDKLSPLLPKSLNTKIAGGLICDLSVNGRISNFENAKIKNINTVGTIVASDVVYTNTSNPNPIHVKKGLLNFTENDVKIPVMSLSAGKSDLILSGSARNLLGFAFNNQTLTGNMTISSELFDVGDFALATEGDTSNNTDGFELPRNIDVNVVYDIQEFQYTHHDFQAVKGSCTLKDQELNIKELSTNCLDGQVVLSGIFNTTDINKPLANLNLVVQNLNIQKSFQSFETLRKLAPVAERIKGKFSSTIKVNTELLGDMSPNLANITCQGVLDLFDCDIEGLQAMNDIGNKLELASFKKPIKLKDLLMSFRIQDGKIEVNPFTVPVGESTLNMVGYSKLDNSINFDGLLRIPKQLYESNQSHFNSLIPKTHLSNLDSIEWSDLQFDVSILGSFNKPIVKLDYKSTRKRVVDNVKDQVKSKIDDQKEVLRKQARDKLDAAKEQADIAKKAAEERAKAAIEEQKRKLAEQAAKEKAAATKKVEEELKKRRQELLKNKLPVPIK